MRRDLSALLLIALALVFAGDAGARSKKQASASTQTSSEGRNNMGLALGYLRSGNLKSALEYATRAVKTDPGSAEVHTMLGMIYAQIGDQGKAQNEYERALSLAPTDGNVLNAYGAYACEQGKYAVAEAQFAKALADPFNRQPAQALANAGKCARKAGDLAKAETYLRQAVDKDPDSAEALFTLAEVQLALGRPMEARAFIQRREALGAADARVLELAARVEDAAGDSRAAARYRERLRNLNHSPETPTQGGTSQP